MYLAKSFSFMSLQINVILRLRLRVAGDGNLLILEVEVAHIHFVNILLCFLNLTLNIKGWVLQCYGLNNIIHTWLKFVQ